MPKPRNDASTVLSGGSSLRNLIYEPSQHGSASVGSHHSDGESAASAMSSVLSSVKRTLRAKREKGGFSTQSCSTRQSEGFWQDSESEADLYSTSSEEEYDPQKPAYRQTKISSPRVPVEHKQPQKHYYSGGKLDHESVDTTEGSTCPSESSGEVKIKECKTEASNGRNDTSKYSRKQKEEEKEKPHKRLRFSTEAFAEAAQSRLNETRHTLRHKKAPIPTDEFGRLDHVSYVSELDTASTNQDISTLHPLGKDECNEVFKNRVPFVVPVSQPSSDDMSSIHALSTRLPRVVVPDLDVESQHEQEVIPQEERGNAVPITTISDAGLPQHTQGTVIQTKPRQCFVALLSNRSNYEIFFTALVGVSLTTLIILLVILFVM